MKNSHSPCSAYYERPPEEYYEEHVVTREIPEEEYYEERAPRNEEPPRVSQIIVTHTS